MKKLCSLALGICIIFIIYYICLIFTRYFNIPFPAPILGILVLFCLLQFKIFPPDLIKDSCNLLLKFMVLFFIPLFVGIIKYTDLIGQNIIPIICTVFITTFMIILSVGLFFEYALKYTRLYKLKRGRK